MSRIRRTDLTAVEPEEAFTCAGVRYAATAYRPGGVTGPAAGGIEFPPGWTKRPPLPAHVPASNQMRVYVPYGQQWYGYFMRRLAQRPANVRFFLRSLITTT